VVVDQKALPKEDSKAQTFIREKDLKSHLVPKEEEPEEHLKTRPAP
jgi:hypothetical protein